MASTTNRKEIIQRAENFIRGKFEGESSGHDWWHIHRVRNIALFLAEKEGGDMFLIEMAALLHDLDDWKLTGDSGSNRIKTWLMESGVPDADTDRIIEIIDQVSFKGAGVETKAISVEAKIVQDADRLDAIGAIGIARTFAYGGYKRRPIYDPQLKPEIHHSFDSYKKSDGPTINHFYEKLLLLKDRMNTNTAKKLALERHQIIVNFLKDFLAEWDFNPNKILPVQSNSTTKKT